MKGVLIFNSILAIVAGIVIFILPDILNYLVAAFFLFFGVSGLMLASTYKR